MALISESMARHFFGSGDPIGGTFVLGADTGRTVIVGVVEDARHERLRSDIPSRMVYLPLAQISRGPDGASVPSSVTIALRTSQDPAAAASSLRDAVRSISKDAMVRPLNDEARPTSDQRSVEETHTARRVVVSSYRRVVVRPKVAGEPSRWNTLRALRVLRWADLA